MNRTSTLQVDYATTTGMFVVVLPPSSLDTEGQMRVLINDTLHVREYDPDMEQP